nr:L-proline--[L-prolyl-carrier protein] ligase-like [Nerophis lumbriciformis]
MPRQLESAVAVFGILRAGAVFVPLDPQLPLGGLRRLVEDCDIEWLISVDAQLSMLRQLAAEGVALRCVIGPAGEVGGEIATLPWNELETVAGGSAPEVGGSVDDPAYLMYSSGSTGRPKGIVHTHHSGLAYAELSVATYGVESSDRIGNHSPLHFDMSTFGYLSVPLAGATTLLVPEAYTKLVASLSQLMESERLTIWYSVPLVLIQLLARGVLAERDLSSLRWVLYGGEPFARKHLHALMRAWPQARFSNVYGPAEVNQCTYFHLSPWSQEAQQADEAEAVPIGRTWLQTDALLLDSDQQLVQGVGEGELLIASPTRMQGYWGRPDLDQRSFVPMTPEGGGGERVFYRTGDLVRRRADGEMTFLGRLDRQVKVRGYRVELDEIERSLSSSAAVEEAVVFPLRVDGQVEHLQAVVTRAADDSETVSADTDLVGDLRAFVAGQLSWYAVPKQIEVVHSLPRTSSGKTDRRRLQLLAEQQLVSSSGGRR